MNTTTSATPTNAATTQNEHRPTVPQYKMRPLRTDAERAAAAALVDDRSRQLAERGITVPTATSPPTKTPGRRASACTRTPPTARKYSWAA